MKAAKLGIKFVGVTIGMLILGLALMIVVYMLPTGRMKSNIAFSHETFNYEGIYPQVINGYKSTQLDNYTDALMYATAIHPGSGNVVKDALRNARFEYTDTNMAQALNDYANDVSAKEEVKYEMEYARYWHGYLVILKPLLLFFNVGEIRMLNIVLQGSLLILLLYFVRKQLGEPYQIPVFVMLAVLNPIVLPLSLQFSWVYYIALFGAIAIVGSKNPYAQKKYVFIFWILGMLTSYMDLLTYPLITLGLPLVLLLLRYRSENLKRQLFTVLESGLFWGIGYAAMWMGKWLFAGVLGGIDIFNDVFGKIQERTSLSVESTENLSVGAIWERNVGILTGWPYLLLSALFVVCCVILYRKSRRNIRPVKGIPYIPIAILPFVWYALLSNHSWIHYWFTYRELAITVLAGAAGIMEMLMEDKKEEVKIG